MWDAESLRDRRREMRTLLEHYAVGRAPPAPDNLRSSVVETRALNQGTVDYRRVRIEFGPANVAHLELGVFTPQSSGRLPVVVFPGGTPPGAEARSRLPLGPGQQQDSAAPRLDAEAVARDNPALKRGFAYVVFNPNDLAENTRLRGADGSLAFAERRLNGAYSSYKWGVLGTWAWGLSRVVDYLVTDPAIDPERIVVSGFSDGAKAAMIAGALDERIAMVAPIASGAGGVGTYRHSGAGNDNVSTETFDRLLQTEPQLFAARLQNFRGHPERLPFDQHFFPALVAPRLFLALESETDPEASETAIKRSILSAKPAFALMGVPERLGVHWSNRPHEVSGEDWDVLLTFAQHHLLEQRSPQRFDDFPSDARLPHRSSVHRNASGAEVAALLAEGARLDLWNGSDLEGWILHREEGGTEEPAGLWSVEAGALHLESRGRSYIRTEAVHADYHLHLEWRWPREGSAPRGSGVMLHVNGPDLLWPASYELQLEHKNSGRLAAIGVALESAPLVGRSRGLPRFTQGAEEPRGAWNTVDIYCRNDTIDAFINDVRHNYAENLESSSGHIGVRLAEGPLELRNLWVAPLLNEEDTAGSEL